MACDEQRAPTHPEGTSGPSSGVNPTVATATGPDYRLTWTVTGGGSGSWPQSNLPFWTAEVSRIDGLSWIGTADISVVNGTTQVTAFSMSGSFSTVTSTRTTFFCSQSSTPQTLSVTDFAGVMVVSEAAKDLLHITETVDQAGNRSVLDPFSSGGLRGSTLPALNTLVTTVTGADCSGPQSVDQTQTDPGFFTGLVFSPGNIPATDETGTTFSKQTSITYYPDPANAVPFTVTWDVTVLKNPPPPGVPPIADAGGPYSGAANAPIALDGSNSSDPDGALSALAYHWDFGDGTTGSGVFERHTFVATGTFVITLTVTDLDGLSDTDQTVATVTGFAPVADAGGAYSGQLNLPIPFDGSGSSDPDGSAATLTYSWDFGDNTTGTGVNAAHGYGAYGTYTVVLTVTDATGLSDTDVTTAVVLCDRFESNDKPVDATPIQVGAAITDSRLCAGDTDYFRFTVAESEVLFIELAPPSGRNYSLSLRDAADVELASGENPSDLAETVVFEAEPGTYFLVVSLASGAADQARPYALTWRNGFLSFPLRQRNPVGGPAQRGVGIHAVFDHSQPASTSLPQYCPDNFVKAYTGETGSVEAPFPFVDDKQCTGTMIKLHSYYHMNGTDFAVNGNYVGWSFSRGPGNSVKWIRNALSYDGHVGYDFQTTAQDQHPLGLIPVLATADGVVRCTFKDLGQTPCDVENGEVAIVHMNGYTTHYGHLETTLVKRGDHVRRGQQIGIAGSTGVSGGPHLHFEVQRSQNLLIDPDVERIPVDPYGWVPQAPDPYFLAFGAAWGKNIWLWRTP
jgi:chitodextrinase